MTSELGPRIEFADFVKLASANKRVLDCLQSHLIGPVWFASSRIVPLHFPFVCVGVPAEAHSFLQLQKSAERELKEQYCLRWVNKYGNGGIHYTAFRMPVLFQILLFTIHSRLRLIIIAVCNALAYFGFPHQKPTKQETAQFLISKLRTLVLCALRLRAALTHCQHLWMKLASVSALAEFLRPIFFE